MSLIDTDPALATMAAEEQKNNQLMEQQFERFTIITTEINKKLAALALAFQTQSADSPSLAPMIQESYLLFLELKTITRQLTNMAETTKGQINNRKKRLDAINLQCESILYERGHFLKEIAVAADFHSKFPPIELVNDAEFFRSHPDARSLDSHQLKVARLKDEYTRREELLKSQRELEATNDALAAKNDAMKSRRKAFNDRMRSLLGELKSSEGDFFPEAAAVPMER